MIKVYIASPYTIGDAAVNVKRQIDTGNKLMDYGFNPYVPLLSHFLHMAQPRSHKEWLEISPEWVLSCDAVLRLDGESSGADYEEELAKANGIPIFYKMANLRAHFKL